MKKTGYILSTLACIVLLDSAMAIERKVGTFCLADAHAEMVMDTIVATKADVRTVVAMVNTRLAAGQEDQEPSCLHVMLMLESIKDIRDFEKVGITFVMKEVVAVGAVAVGDAYELEFLFEHPKTLYTWAWKKE